MRSQYDNKSRQDSSCREQTPKLAKVAVKGAVKAVQKTEKSNNCRFKHCRTEKTKQQQQQPLQSLSFNQQRTCTCAV